MQSRELVPRSTNNKQMMIGDWLNIEETKKANSIIIGPINPNGRFRGGVS